MKYENEIETPGWKPAGDEERRAVANYCVTIGMPLDEALLFIRYNAMRRWMFCERGSVADAARQWLTAYEEHRGTKGEDVEADYRKAIKTPGWWPVTYIDRKAVVDYCVGLGMSEEKAGRFVCAQRVRQWSCCIEGGTVAAAADEWNRTVEELPPPPDKRRHEEIMQALREIGKGQERLLALLRAVLEGKEGEAEVRRILADVPVEGDAVDEREHFPLGGMVAPVGGGLEREAVDHAEGVEAGAERVGAEG